MKSYERYEAPKMIEPWAAFRFFPIIPLALPHNVMHEFNFGS